MLINESGLVRAIKRAYKSENGYVVYNNGQTISIYADHWYINAHRAMMPRKVLATIVEHVGTIPEMDAPTSIQKDGEPQLVMRETAKAAMTEWYGGRHIENAWFTRVNVGSYQAFQSPELSCWGSPATLIGIVDHDQLTNRPAKVMDNKALLWEVDGETVAIIAVRKAESGWAKEWERAVWTTLETLGLNEEEAGRS